jgi:ElaA protein
MMKQAVDQVCRIWPGMGIRISAQAYLEGFYAAYGFEKASDVYLEDGIPHVEMIRGG